MKETLLRAFDLTAGTFRRKFRNGKPGEKETPKEYTTHLKRRVELSDASSFDQFLDLRTQDEFIEGLNSEVVTFLLAGDFKSLGEILKQIECYIESKGRTRWKWKKWVVLSWIHGRIYSRKNKCLQKCYHCGSLGYMRANCPHQLRVFGPNCETPKVLIIQFKEDTTKLLWTLYKLPIVINGEKGACLRLLDCFCLTTYQLLWNAKI